ncbi:MAG: polysaccharide deacetylase family protein [Elusimicrobia bacterium]|nr:polysaccharide deacetylase family protein [Elusimicrobiota bacterium]
MSAFIASMLLLLAASPCAGSGGPPSASALRREGASLSRQARYERAAEPLTRAAELLGSDPLMEKDAMWALWRAGDREGALRAAARARARDPKDMEAADMLALLQHSTGRAREALESYLAADALAPGRLSVQGALASLYERNRDYERALERNGRALALAPRDAPRHAQRGRLLALLDRRPEAEASWSRAAELAPGDDSYRFELARARYFAGRREEAARDLRDLLARRPRDGRALDLLIQIAVVNRRLDWALPSLERRISDEQPQDEPRRLELAGLYGAAGRPDEMIRVLDRSLTLDPDDGDALRAKAEALVAAGRAEEAAPLFARLVERNPASAPARRSLAQALHAAGRSGSALAASREARALDPRDPYLLIEHSRLLHENGERKAARALLEGWLASNREEVLPVLLYHGLATRASDPMLASPVHIGEAAFRAQMKALRGAGFTAVTSAEAAAWFQRRAGLPPRPVLITFDDARLDSLRVADPVLRELGLKATMFAPLINVEANLPGYAAWDDLAAYGGSGRWELAAHGDRAHGTVEKDARGRRGLFLTNRRWLASERRLETEEEWARRARADHASSKRKLLERLGSEPRAFAYPEGDYGQHAPNLADAAPLTLKLCRDSYEVCFTQDSRGINARSVDPARATRLEPRGDWTGERLVRHLRDQSPVVQARRVLLRQLSWDGQESAARRLLEENRRAGASEPVLLHDEARVLLAVGDRDGALRLAQRALALEASGENERLVAELERASAVRWTGEFAWFDDDQGRENLEARQSLGPWPRFGVENVTHFHSTHREPGVSRVTGNGAGVALARAFGAHRAGLRLEGRALNAGAPDALTAIASLRSRWSDSLATALEGGRQPYQNARSLLAGVRENLVSLAVSWEREDALSLGARLRLADLTDGNRRATGSASASHPAPLVPGLRAVARVSTDAVERLSPDYYSPMGLRTISAGLSWSGRALPWLTARASCLPGYAREAGAAGSFVHELDASLDARWGRWGLLPWVSHARTPTYRSTTFGAALEHRF